MANDEEREIHTPLLHPNNNSSVSEIQAYIEQHEIIPSSISHQDQHFPSISPISPSPKNQRLISLDVFRGLTIAFMILVDDAGGAFPYINHAPWYGVTIADFVMPAFLFIVGVSIGLVFKKVPSKSTATKKVILRTIKLFVLGIFVQGILAALIQFRASHVLDFDAPHSVFWGIPKLGGFFHGRGKLSYGVDVLEIRWLGVLQRISIAYLFASISEIWLVKNVMVDSPLKLLRRYYLQWIATILLCILYTTFLYGLHVPSWNFELQGMNSTLSPSSFQVQCGVRGSLDPPCNAVGFIDRLLLGVNHLYQRPVYRRVKECSVNSPDYGSLPPNAPGWCLAPFDPEGILSSLTAAVTCFVGLHFGHIIAHFKDHMQRMILWSISAIPLIILGYMMMALGMPLSKPLYTLSYMCITAGASGFIFTIIFYLVDVIHITKPMVLLQWLGMNALIIYVLAACEIFPVLLQGFYWGSPENNLVDGTESFLRKVLGSKSWGTLAFVMLEIVFWGFFAGVLHRRSIYIRL